MNPRFRGSIAISSTTTWYNASLDCQFAKENNKNGMSLAGVAWRT